MFRIKKNDALIIVDVQNCFCPGGELPIKEGDRIIPVFNKYIKKFNRAGAKIFATRDWHPINHESFKAYGGIWPPHCVQNSEGAKFHPYLKLPSDTIVISTGFEPSIVGYSGFDHTDLEGRLKKDNISRVFIGGLATDYCVKHTVLDSLEKGFKTILLIDSAAGIDLEPGDIDKAVEQMLSKGAVKTTLSEFE